MLEERERPLPLSTHRLTRGRVRFCLKGIIIPGVGSDFGKESRNSNEEKRHKRGMEERENWGNNWLLIS